MTLTLPGDKYWLNIKKSPNALSLIGPRQFFRHRDFDRNSLVDWLKIMLLPSEFLSE